MWAFADHRQRAFSKQSNTPRFDWRADLPILNTTMVLLAAALAPLPTADYPAQYLSDLLGYYIIRAFFTVTRVSMS